MNTLLRAFPEYDVLEFWFGNACTDVNALSTQSKRWFAGGVEVDHEVKKRFGSYFLELPGVDASEFESPQIVLAAVLLFDQFSRNCFRGQAEAFAYDIYALDLLDYALEQGFDASLHPLQRAFLYMPLQHIETLDGQNYGVYLFERLASEAPSGYETILRANADYALEHRDLIGRFGRFPHRNNVLGRSSTPEEIAYLESGAKRYGQ